jgi:hypothetical protein
MQLLDELIELERGFWRAARDKDYYTEHMAGDGVLVFGQMIMDKAGAVGATFDPSNTPWEAITISRPQLIRIADDVVAIVYQGSGIRGERRYIANTTSVYANRNGAWMLVLHQQSPLIG